MSLRATQPTFASQRYQTFSNRARLLRAENHAHRINGIVCVFDTCNEWWIWCCASEWTLFASQRFGKNAAMRAQEICIDIAFVYIYLHIHIIKSYNSPFEFRHEQNIAVCFAVWSMVFLFACVCAFVWSVGFNVVQMQAHLLWAFSLGGSLAHTEEETDTNVKQMTAVFGVDAFNL